MTWVNWVICIMILLFFVVVTAVVTICICQWLMKDMNE